MTETRILWAIRCDLGDVGDLEFWDEGGMLPNLFRSIHAAQRFIRDEAIPADGYKLTPIRVTVTITPAE